MSTQAQTPAATPAGNPAQNPVAPQRDPNLRFERTESAPGSVLVQPAVKPANPVAVAANPSPTDPAAAPAGSDAAKPEAKPDEKQPDEKQAKGTDYARKLAMLQRREAQLVAQDRQIKAQRQQMKAIEAQLKAEANTAREELARFRAERDAMKADPLKWLEYGGHSYDAASQQMLNDKKPLPEDLIRQTREELEAKINKLNEDAAAALESEKQAQQERARQRQLAAQQQAEQTVNQFRNETVEYVSQNAEEFKLTNLYGVQTQVPALIEAYYEQTLRQDIAQARAERRPPRGRIIEPKQAAKMVEDHLKQLHQKVQEAITPAEKKQAQAAVDAATGNAAPASEKTPIGQRPEITNREVATPAPRASDKPLTADERYKRALAALNATGAVRPGAR